LGQGMRPLRLFGGLVDGMCVCVCWIERVLIQASGRKTELKCTAVKIHIALWRQLIAPKPTHSDPQR